MNRKENNSKIGQQNKDQNSNQRNDRNQSTDRENVSTKRGTSDSGMSNLRDRQSTTHGSGITPKSSVSGSDYDGQVSDRDR